MSRYSGREVVLELATYAGLNNGKDNGFDWSAWGNIQLKSPSLGVKLVYDREAKIYENNEVFPRAFVVYGYEFLTKKEDILKRLKDPDFPLRDKIILEEDLPETLRSAITNHPVRSDAKIKQYSSQQVEILADMKSPGFLVLSDLYYPGWNAYVDGKKVKIYQTNYILRSIFLGAGAHTVKFVYEPTSFRVGAWISGTAALFIAILVGVWLFLKRRARRPARTESRPARIQN